MARGRGPAAAAAPGARGVATGFRAAGGGPAGEGEVFFCQGQVWQDIHAWANASALQLVRRAGGDACRDQGANATQLAYLGGYPKNLEVEAFAWEAEDLAELEGRIAVVQASSCNFSAFAWADLDFMDKAWSLEAHGAAGMVYVAAHPYELPEASRVFVNGRGPFPTCTMDRANYDRLAARVVEARADGEGEGGGGGGWLAVNSTDQLLYNPYLEPTLDPSVTALEIHGGWLPGRSLRMPAAISSFNALGEERPVTAPLVEMRLRPECQSTSYPSCIECWGGDAGVGDEGGGVRCSTAPTCGGRSLSSTSTPW